VARGEYKFSALAANGRRLRSWSHPSSFLTALFCFIMRSAASLLLLTAALAEAAPNRGWRPGNWRPKHHKGGYWKPTHTQSWSYPTSTGTVPTSTATALPLVDSAALQASILEENLSDKALELQDAAYSTPDRNRVMSSQGHLNTIDFLTGYLDEHADYYTYEVQDFIALYAQSSGTLTVDGQDQGAEPFEYTPSGNVTAPFIAVANLGCEASDYPAEVEGAIALIARGTCEFGLKSALAGSAGALAAVIYNSASGPIGGGTLGPPPRPEGDYIATVGIAQENGTAILAALEAGEVTGVLSVDSVIENRTTYSESADCHTTSCY
jgi:hypothetical protein